ncbi:MAG: metallophosphoesterase [Lachnospiraceae bacterium]|nr:metallophosphoesterase [Lachnospiraceae bacterium]
MRILVVSDTHGREENFYKVLEKEKDIDMVLHCGDFVGGAERMEEKCPVPFCAVTGNCDFSFAYPSEKEFVFEGKKVWMTHGHRFGVNYGLDSLYAEAVSFHYDVVLYGHTHRPLVRDVRGTLIINPGSLTQPRQEDRKPSYAILWINPDGTINAEIRYV